MVIEREQLPLPPGVLAQVDQRLFVVQLSRQLLDVREVQADVELARERLGGDDGITVIKLDERQPGRGQGW